MAMLEFDERAARHIQRVYSTPDVVAQRERVLALLSPQPGERILDVGSGPGFLVASLADAVGPDGVVHGLDPSAPMNALAAELTAARPQAHIDTGDALEMPYPTRRSTRRSRPRSTSTWPTSRRPSPNCAGC